MSNTPPIDSSKRQVLVNLGNRFVVFGPEAGLPVPLRFDPRDSVALPRVADEREVAEARIAETLQVSGMTRGAPGLESAKDADIEFVDSAGKRILVEVKVRERDPKQRDLQPGIERLNLAKSAGQNLEVWFFNIERLKLTVMRLEGSNLEFDDFVPLSVWEKTSEGIYERQRVVEEVDDWLRRIEELYTYVQEWLSEKQGLRFEQTRTITMSEEIMQKFAVTDRELAVLDVLREDHVVASFVPRGLWLVGSWGRVDVITKDRTSVLLAIKKADTFEWFLAMPNDRRSMNSFDKSALLELMSGQ
jgi:hypothetical protein